LQATTPDEARLTANFAAFCALAQQFGIGANLEPMPWTDCKDFAQGVRIVTAAGHENGGVLIDPIHFDRGGSTTSEIAGVPPARFRYMQLCDAPAERPSDIQGLLYQARAERLLPGDGGLDLIGMLREVPGDLPISLEIPMETLAKTLPARADEAHARQDATPARPSLSVFASQRFDPIAPMKS
jgi:sugar phosphate isomerase/epimerase